MMNEAAITGVVTELMGQSATGKAGVKVVDADLNNERLLIALNNAIQARGKIESEQARYDKLIEEYEATRASLIEANVSPHEITEIENEIADATYHRWLVAQQLNRAADSAEERLAYLQTLDTPEKQQAERELCANGLEGLLHWWRYWAWTADPRPDAPLTFIPFLPFEFQEQAISWIWNLVNVRMKDGHLDKSRDLGASWIATTFAAACWLTARSDQPFLCTFGSRKEDLVDKIGDGDTLIEKCRITLRLVPGWMLPKGFSFAKNATFLRIVHPVTSSMIKGESANDDFARGGRQVIVVFDESASWPGGGYAAWTAASESARTRLAISTPKGKFNKFGELKEDKHINHYSMFWSQHPWKTQQAYEIARRRLSEVELAQEWDLDYEGSVAGRLLWMFSEVHSVITWSEFARFFGEEAIDQLGNPRIPAGWKHRVAHDCGTTDDHPSVIIGAAMSPAGSKLPRHLFLYEQIFHGEGAHPLILAPIIKEKFKPYVKEGDVEAWLISHEANAERLIYNQEFGLPFEQWNTEAGYSQGYPQTQHYFTPYPGPHPFRPQIEGHPRAFLIVEDRQGKLSEVEDVAISQPVPSPELFADTRTRKEYVQKLIGAMKSRWKVASPLNEEGGFKRTREELPRIHIPQSEAGKPTKAQRHFKKFDDAFDVVRAIMAQMPSMVGLTEAEKIQQRLRDEFKAQKASETMVEDQYAAWYAYDDERHAIEREIQAENLPSRPGGMGTPIQTFRDRRG